MGFSRGAPSRASIEAEAEAFVAAMKSKRLADGHSDPKIPLPEVPYLKFAAGHTGGHALSLVLLNRSLDQPMQAEVECHSFPGTRVAAAGILYDQASGSAHTRNAPDCIRPAPLRETTVRNQFLSATLPPASWTVRRLEPDDEAAD